MIRKAQRSRKTAERRGRWAEQVAALLLILKGYRILGRRQRFPLIEVDIIARKGPMLVLVEVKYRRRIEDAIAALHPEAVVRLQRTAAQMTSQRLNFSNLLTSRVDLVAVAPWRWPVHVRHIT